ncbi:hypothetical protein BH09VER1_BH09VER1_51940 [soil metagenome]
MVSVSSSFGVPRYSIGTLVYSRAGLLSLFGWLLWGDFIFNLMEQVMPTLLPLTLKDHGASNQEILFIVSTLFMVMNSALNPVISYKSDRFRSRWGRRRPFIVVTTPFVVLFLAAIPFAPEILTWLQSIGSINHLFSLSPVAPLFLIFGLLVAGFQVFNMFISSVYYYLIPDVVPSQFIGQFYGLFRVFGALAGMAYNYLIFGLAEHYMSLIFVTTALIYGGFILLMCWRVREGEYPPPASEPHEHWWNGIQNYLRECFGHSYYWWVFLAYSALGWGNAGNTFIVFFYRDDLGFSLDLIGKMNTWSSFFYLILAYPFGLLIDRWDSHRALILGTALTIVFSILMYFFAVDRTSAIIWTLLRNIPLALAGMALLKWTIEVYPKARYGQFGSAGALFSSLGGIAASFCYPYWMNLAKGYNSFLLWNALFAGLGLAATLVVYRRWKALGAPAQYCPP